MKATQNKSRKLALRPETVAVLTRRRLTEIVGGSSSGSCETNVSVAVQCGPGQGDNGVE